MKSKHLFIISALSFMQVFQLTYANSSPEVKESIQKRKYTKSELNELKNKFKKLMAEFEIKEEKAKIKIAEIEKEKDSFREKKIADIKSIIEKNKLQLKKLSEEIKKIEDQIKDEASIEVSSQEDTDILVCQSQLDNESLESHIKELIKDQEVIIVRVAKERDAVKPEPIKVSKDYTSNDLVSYFSEITSQILLQNQMQMQLFSQLLFSQESRQYSDYMPYNQLGFNPYSIDSLYLGNQPRSYSSFNFNQISPYIGSSSYNLPQYYQNQPLQLNRDSVSPFSLNGSSFQNQLVMGQPGFDFRPSLQQLEKTNLF